MGRFKSPPSDQMGVNTHPDAASERGDGFRTVLEKLNDSENYTTLDFGAFPGASDASVTITGLTDIDANSVPEAWIVPIATDDHTADEHLADPPAVYAGLVVAGTGFTIYGVNQNFGDQRTYGKWTVGYRWN